MFHAWDLQKAIYTKLGGSSGLIVNGKKIPIYDDVPKKVEKPYIVIGNITSNQFDTQTTNGQEFTITIHSWTNYRGKKQALEVMGGVYTLLHRTAISVDNGNLVDIQQEFTNILPEATDGRTRQGIQRFRVVITD